MLVNPSPCIYDKKADLVVPVASDVFMKYVVEELGVELPVYTYTQKYKVSVTRLNEMSCVIKVEGGRNNEPVTCFEEIMIKKNGEAQCYFLDKDMKGNYSIETTLAPDATIQLVLEDIFKGEPIEINIPNADGYEEVFAFNREVDYNTEL